MNSQVLKTLEHLDLAPFRHHLEELRSRLLKVLAFFCTIFLLAYWFSEEIMRILLTPLSSSYLGSSHGLVYTALTEGFFAYLKIAFWTALLLTTPFFVYQAWAFVAPGLYPKEKSFLRRIVFWGGALFFAGGFFGFFVLFPTILAFSLGYAAQDLLPMPRIGQYVVLLVKFVFFTGLVFEVPFTMALAIESGIIERETIKKKRKFFLIGLYALSAFLVPTDIFSQILLFGPLWLLFELGLKLSIFIHKRND